MSKAIPASVSNEKLIIAGRAFSSRLIIGTGKYRSYDQMRSAHEASGAEMVTVAVRRVPLDRSSESFLDYLSPSLQILPKLVFVKPFHRLSRGDIIHPDPTVLFVRKRPAVRAPIRRGNRGAPHIHDVVNRDRSLRGPHGPNCQQKSQKHGTRKRNSHGYSIVTGRKGAAGKLC